MDGARGEFIVGEYHEGRVEVSVRFTGEQPSEPYWFETETGAGVIGVTTLKAESVRFTGGRRPRVVGTEPIPGHPSMRRYAAFFKGNEAASLRRLILRDDEGNPLLRETVPIDDW
jgi:hypothetical protein